MAEIIYDRYPEAISITKDLLRTWAKNGDLGYLLWASVAFYINDEILSIAGEYGHLSIVKIFIEELPVYNLKGKYALIGALKGNHAHIIHYLLDSKSIHPILASKALIEASEKGQTEIVELLVEYGADPTIEASKAMERATIHSHSSSMEKLVVSPHVYSSDLGSIFYLAIRHNRYNIAKIILDTGKMSHSWIISTLSLAEREKNWLLMDFLEEYLADKNL